MTFFGIIPARYASTRFPGKPLALLAGKTVIERVYERVSPLMDHTVVATDDERIRDAVLSFGGNAVMTSPHHKSGTDRCHEAYTLCDGSCDVVANIQGDEPFVSPDQIETLKACFTTQPDTQIATLAKPFLPTDGIERLQNPNSPKVVFDSQMRALCFSRSVIPYIRDAKPHSWLAHHTFYKHIGIYAYRPDTLRQLTLLPQSTLELAESLEQLRWLQNGYTIRIGITHTETIGIDTPEDLKRAEEHIAHMADLPA